MSADSKQSVGRIVWQDLTVKNAPIIRDFYNAVVGWEGSPHDMEDYVDFDIKVPGSDEVIAGICHARDANENMPAQWLLYVTVADVVESVHRCVALGGKIIDGPRLMGDKDFCVIQDPAGAMMALIEQ